MPKSTEVEGHHEGRSNLLNIGAGKLGKGIKKFGNLGRKMLEASDSDEEKAGKERETKDKKSSKKRNKESKVTEEDQPDDEDLDEKVHYSLQSKSLLTFTDIGSRGRRNLPRSQSRSSDARSGKPYRATLLT